MFKNHKNAFIQSTPKIVLRILESEIVAKKKKNYEKTEKNFQRLIARSINKNNNILKKKNEEN